MPYDCWKWRSLSPGASFHTPTRRSGCAYGSGRSSTASTTVKIATLAPMPTPRVITATSRKPGRCRSSRASERSVERTKPMRNPSRKPSAASVMPYAREAPEVPAGASPGCREERGSRQETLTFRPARRHGGPKRFRLSTRTELRPDVPRGVPPWPTCRRGSGTISWITSRIAASFPSSARSWSRSAKGTATSPSTAGWRSGWPRTSASPPPSWPGISTSTTWSRSTCAGAGSGRSSMRRSTACCATPR